MKRTMQCRRRCSLATLATLTLAALSGACASSAKKAPSSALDIALVVSKSCCKAQKRADALKRALASKARLAHVVEVEPTQSGDPAGPSSALSARVDKAVSQASASYQRMRMKRARELLAGALRDIERGGARGVSGRQIASIHLLLAAAALAEGRKKDVRQHAAHVVTHAPDLDPDPALVSPPLRAALARAKKRRREVPLTVRSVPSDVQVSWDGVTRGRTPLSLPKVATGAHYLALDHPLYETERRMVNVTAKTDTLTPRLRPGTVSRIASAIAADPARATMGARLLGVAAVCWMHEDASGEIVLDVFRQDGATRQVRLDASASASRVDAAAFAVASSVSSGASSAGGSGARRDDRGHFRKYWWVYAAAGAVALGLGIALPLTLSGSRDGRDIVLPLP